MEVVGAYFEVLEGQRLYAFCLNVNPDGATPKPIVDKMIEAAGKTATHRHSLSKGIPQLRKAICTGPRCLFDGRK